MDGCDICADKSPAKAATRTSRIRESLTPVVGASEVLIARCVETGIASERETLAGLRDRVSLSVIS